MKQPIPRLKPFSIPAETANPPAESSDWWNEPVPYNDDGVIDWGRLEDDMPTADAGDGEFFDLQVQAIDFSRPQPSNLHPYYHQTPGIDCTIVAHKCSCSRCRQDILVSPVRKRSREEAIEIEDTPVRSVPNAIEVEDSVPQFGGNHPVPVGTPRAKTPPPAAPARAKRARKQMVPESPPPVGIAASDNLFAHVETLADTAEMPAAAQQEKAASTTEKGETKVPSHSEVPHQSEGSAKRAPPLRLGSRKTTTQH